MLIALAVVVAFASAGLAGFLALAEEAPSSLPAPAEETEPPGGGPLPERRAMQVTRLVLLLVASVALGWSTAWWVRPAWHGAWALVASTLMLVVLGDLLPRLTASAVPELASAAAPAARRVLGALGPWLQLAAKLERGIQRVLPPRASREVLAPAQRDILLGVFSLGDATVAEVMTPRLDIVALEAGAAWPDVVNLLRQGQHARMPVYAGTLDNIVGIVRAKDFVGPLTGVAPPPARWQDLIRPVQFVPETKSLAAQLRDFQRGVGELAIVVDEFGGTSGLVTLEDVLEEVVGEIHDEYDVDETPAIRREGDHRFWVDGRVTLETLSELLGVPLAREEVSTVGGLIYSALGRVPRQGEELHLAGFRIVVEEVARRRIRRVYLEREPPHAGTGAEDRP